RRLKTSSSLLPSKGGSAPRSRRLDLSPAVGKSITARGSARRPAPLASTNERPVTVSETTGNQVSDQESHAGRDDPPAQRSEQQATRSVRLPGYPLDQEPQLGCDDPPAQRSERQAVTVAHTRATSRSTVATKATPRPRCVRLLGHCCRVDRYLRERFDDLHRLGLGKGAGFPFATHQSGGSWNLIGSSFVVAQSIRKRLAHRRHLVASADLWLVDSG